MASEFHQPAVAQLESDKRGAIGSDAKVRAPGLPFALSEIIGQPREDIRHPTTEVPLELEDCGLKQRVSPAANLRHADFVVQIEVGCVERVSEKLRHQTADGLVTGSRCQSRNEFGQMMLPPGLIHNATMRTGCMDTQVLASAPPQATIPTMPRRFAAQPDLFAPAEPDLFTAVPGGKTGSLADELEEHPGEEFIQEIRDELLATLELARRSANSHGPT